MAEVTQECREAVLSNDYYDFLTEYNGSEEYITATFNSDCYFLINHKYAVVHVSRRNIPILNIQTFGYNSIPKLYGLMDQSSMDRSGILRIQNQPVLNLRGRGVIIGVFDTGIDYTNPIFQNANGTSRIMAIWDQTIQSDNPPEGFGYGTEYTKEDIDEALRSDDPLSIVPSIDTNGHGTFQAGIAGGGYDAANDFIGAAPDATFLIVKLKQAKPYLIDYYALSQDILAFQDTDIFNAIKYLDEKSRLEGMPISMCFGLGTNSGSRDNVGSMVDYLDIVAARAGVAITNAAGNEGLAGHHYFGEVNPTIGFDQVELKVGDDTGFMIELWGNTPGLYSVGFTSPTGEVIARIPAETGGRKDINLLLEETMISVDYRIIERETGDELIQMIFRNPTSGIWTIRVYEEDPLYTGFHMWLPITNFLSTGTFFIRPSPDTTIVTPSTARRPITMTAYSHYNGSLYINASRGYGRTSYDITPDLAAPGVDVYGPQLGGTYGTRSGTSVAAAHGTGAAALLLEWGVVRGNSPNMNSIEIKRYLARGARRSNNITYPNREWGYGILDLFNAFVNLL